MGADQALAEFVAGLVEGRGGGVGVHAEQGGGQAERLGLHLDVPQHGAVDRGQALVGALGQDPVLRHERLGRPHPARAGRLAEGGQHARYPFGAGPEQGGVAHGDQQPGAQRGALLAQLEPVEDLVEGGPGDHGGDAAGGGEADHRVRVDRPPVPGDQQGGGLGDLPVRAAAHSGGERLVGLSGVPAGRRVRGTGRAGVSTERFLRGRDRVGVAGSAVAPGDVGPRSQTDAPGSP